MKKKGKKKKKGKDTMTVAQPSAEPALLSTSPPPTSPAIVSIDPAKIRAEEIEKCRVKLQFDKEGPCKYLPYGLWWFATTPIFLTIVLGIIVYCFQKNVEHLRKEEQDYGKRQKLAIELDYRIEKSAAAETAGNAKAHMDGLFIGEIFPEFKSRVLPSLLIELAYLLPPETQKLKGLSENWRNLPDDAGKKEKEIERIRKRIRAIIQPLL